MNIMTLHRDMKWYASRSPSTLIPKISATYITVTQPSNMVMVPFNNQIFGNTNTCLDLVHSRFGVFITRALGTQWSPWRFSPCISNLSKTGQSSNNKKNKSFMYFLFSSPPAHAAYFRAICFLSAGVSMSKKHPFFLLVE
jgi:hypothetical protein